LSRPDADLTAVGPIPQAKDGPVFAEPWQAEAFALVLKLVEDGRFTWSEWAAALGAEIAHARDAAGAPDPAEVADGSAYYTCWLAALEGLTLSKRLVAEAELAARKDAWAEAYRRTPHGQAVRLQP